jgi:hypothetical protein
MTAGGETGSSPVSVPEVDSASRDPDGFSVLNGEEVELMYPGTDPMIVSYNARARIQKPVVTYDIVSYYRKAVCSNLFATYPDCKLLQVSEYGPSASKNLKHNK